MCKLQLAKRACSTR